MNAIYLLPFIAALIGWITNFIAVKMLFHPKKKRSFLFISLHGVFPKRQAALAHRLGQVVSQELFSMEDVKAVLRDKETSQVVISIIEERLEEIITKKLPSVMPMLAMVLNPEFVNTIKGVIIEELEEIMGPAVEKVGEKLEERLDIHTLVEEKVAGFSSDRLEEMLHAIMKKEFRFIELMGAVLGFFIGLCQIALLQYWPGE